MGGYPFESPPPIADYNLTSPWSDPVMPTNSNEQASWQDVESTSPVKGSSEQIGEPAKETPSQSSISAEDDKSVTPQQDEISADVGRASLVDSTQSSRTDTVSPEPEFAAVQRTATIDSVIQAWTKPVQPEQPVAQGTPWNDPGFAPALKQLGLLSNHLDPYQDLSAEAKASLNRFVSMLRKEAAAENDDDKMDIFNSFVKKETRLRAILYGQDIEEAFPRRKIQALKPQNTPDSDSQVTEVPPSNVRPTHEPVSQPLEQTVASITPVQANSSPPAKTDQGKELSVVVDSYQDEGVGSEEYSPGGRPILKKPSPIIDPNKTQPTASKIEDADANVQPSLESRSSILERNSEGRRSPHDDAPIPVREDEGHQKEEDHAIGPQEETAKPLESSRPMQVPRVYTPFRYQAVSQNESSSSLPETTTKSYTTLRKANVDSGRLMAPSGLENEKRTTSPSPGPRQEHAEAFLGLLRQRSHNEGRGRTSSPSTDLGSNPAKLLEKVEKLKALVPRTLPIYAESEKLSMLKRSLRDIPDDFSFIHNAVLQWNRTNLEKKKELDAARRQRAEESERNIDSMFNSDEIGYADITTLEEEHRVEEEKILANEGMQEVESFKMDVFGFVTTTIQSQLNALASVYAEAMTIVERQSACGSQFIRGSSAETPLPQAMDLLLVIYSKMQVRHQKLLEAQLELQRRTRKARVNIIRANGDITQAQDHEMTALKADQGLIIDTKEKDDDRANFLMDTFDKAAVKGLAENQAFIDELLPPLQALVAILDDSGSTNDDFDLKDLLLSTQAVLEFVNADSVSILKFSSTADEILNNADYDISVAKAYQNDASPEQFRSLEREKTKEDAKIKNEAASKIDSMANGCREVEALIQELLRRIESSPGHKERIGKALERAKQRNANASYTSAKVP